LFNFLIVNYGVGVFWAFFGLFLKGLFFRFNFRVGLKIKYVFLLKEYQLGGCVFIFIFFFLFFSSSLRLFGAIPPITANIVFVILFRVSGWCIRQIKKILFLKVYISNIIPSNSPKKIILFLFSVEVFSLFIQPLTLSVRMLANILAGHLLIVLILEGSNVVCYIIAVLLVFLEILVSLVQAVVFVILLIFYSV